MKKRIVFSTLLSVFLLSLMVLMSLAQERVVGVAEGDWFKYGDFDVDWSSTDPNATFPPPGREWFVEINETEWMLISVQNILSSRTIFFQTAKHFEDETERTEGGYLDIDTGAGNMSLKVISANLDVNDTVYTSTPFSTWKIKETIVRTYLDGERETNYLNKTQKWNITRYMDSWTTNGTGYAFINYYWDRSTGVLVEYSYKEIEQVGEYLTTLSMSYRISESNVWTVPEFPLWTSILLILIVFTVIMVIHRRILFKTNGKSGYLSERF